MSSTKRKVFVTLLTHHFDPPLSIALDREVVITTTRDPWRRIVSATISAELKGGDLGARAEEAAEAIFADLVELAVLGLEATSRLTARVRTFAQHRSHDTRGGSTKGRGGSRG